MMTDDSASTTRKSADRQVARVLLPGTLAILMILPGCFDYDFGLPGDVAVDTASDLDPDTEQDTVDDPDADPEPDTGDDVPVDTAMDPEPDTPDDTEVDTHMDTDLDTDMDSAADVEAEPDADVPPITQEYVPIAPGTFSMGSSTSEPGRQPNETQHQVTLTHPFEIMVYPVTQFHFEDLMGYDPAHFGSYEEDCPVESVSWNEAAAFANTLSALDGYDLCYTCTGSGASVSCDLDSVYTTPYDCTGYRLPTEAEWEYAARADTTDATYNGTSTLTDCTSPNSVLDPIAWFCGNSGMGSQPAGRLLPNDWGLYDMLGNVMEWTGDWYVYDLGTDAVTNPDGAATGTERVARGGSWHYGALDARAARRGTWEQDYSGYTVGFRLARTLP